MPARSSGTPAAPLFESTEFHPLTEKQRIPQSLFEWGGKVAEMIGLTQEKIDEIIAEVRRKMDQEDLPRRTG